MKVHCLLLGLAGLLAAGALYAPAQTTPEAAGDVARAQTLAGQQDYEEVLRLLEALPEDGRDPRVRGLLTDAYLATGRFSDARRCANAAIERSPNDAEAHVLLADVLLAEQKCALAAQALEQAERLGLDTPAFHLKLATAYHRLKNYTGEVFVLPFRGGRAGRIESDCYLIDPLPGDPNRFHAAPRKSAIFHLQKALDAGLDDPAARLLHAEIFLHTCRFDRAVQLYRALDGRVAQPDLARYHGGFAQACFGSGDLDGYLEHLRQAATLEPAAYRPRLANAYRAAADRSSAEGDLEQYLRYLRLAIDESPESADLHYTLGNALHEAGRLLEASRQWRLTLELQPDHPDRQRMLTLIRAAAERSPMQ